MNTKTMGLHYLSSVEIERHHKMTVYVYLCLQHNTKKN